MWKYSWKTKVYNKGRWLSAPHSYFPQLTSFSILPSLTSFPGVHFGKLYGLVMSLSAVVSLLQYPCFALVKGALGGDPFYVSGSYKHTVTRWLTSSPGSVAIAREPAGWMRLVHVLCCTCQKVNIELSLLNLITQKPCNLQLAYFVHV